MTSLFLLKLWCSDGVPDLAGRNTSHPNPETERGLNAQPLLDYSMCDEPHSEWIQLIVSILGHRKLSPLQSRWQCCLLSSQAAWDVGFVIVLHY